MSKEKENPLSEHDRSILLTRITDLLSVYRQIQNTEYEADRRERRRSFNSVCEAMKFKDELVK